MPEPSKPGERATGGRPPGDRRKGLRDARPGKGRLAATRLPAATEPSAAKPAAATAGRVIAGVARGARLAAPGSVTRPLGDRVKQTLFAILEPDLRQGAFLDLFAGSGAAGIEALSRGAPGATFVERDRGAEAVIRANLDRAHLGGPEVRVVRAEVLAWLATARAFGNGPFQAVVVDPPYDKPELLRAALERLGSASDDGGLVPILARGAIVVAKHAWRIELPARIGLLASVRARRFGETALTFYRVAEPTEAGA